MVVLHGNKVLFLLTSNLSRVTKHVNGLRIIECCEIQITGLRPVFSADEKVMLRQV